MANAVKAGDAYVKIGVKGGAIFKKQLRKASISIQLFNRRIIKSGKAASMAAAGYKRLTRSIAGVGAMAKTAGAGMASFGKKMLMGVAGIAVPLGLMVKRFATFDDAMRAVAARSGAVGKDLAMLTDRAKELGRTTSFTAVQVAEMMNELALAGFDPKQIEEASGAVLNLSKATGTDLALSAQLAASTMRQFGLKAKDVAMISDIMTKTTNTSAQTLEQFGEAMKMIAPTASKLGADITDVSTSVAILANNGVKGTAAGTALRAAYLQLSKTVNQTKLDKMGVGVKDASGNMRKLVDIVEDLNTAMGGLDNVSKVAKFQDIFGKIGLGSVLNLSGKGDVFKSFQQSLKDSGGEAKKVSDFMESGIGGAFRKMLSALEGVAIKLGSMFVPMVEKAAKVITDFGGAFVTWLQKNPQVIQSFVGIIKKVALFGATLVAGGVALTTFGKGLGGLAFVLGGVGQAFGGLAQMTSGFFASFSLAVGGLFVWNLDFKKFASNVTETFSGMFKAISTIWGAGFEKMAGAFKRGDFESGMKELGSLLKATAQTILNTITNLVDDAMTEITKSFKKTAAMFAKPINIVVRTVQSLVTPGRIGESGDLGEQIGNYEDAELASRKKDKEIKVLQDKYGTNALSGAYKKGRDERLKDSVDEFDKLLTEKRNEIFAESNKARGFASKEAGEKQRYDTREQFEFFKNEVEDESFEKQKQIGSRYSSQIMAEGTGKYNLDHWSKLMEGFFNKKKETTTGGQWGTNVKLDENLFDWISAKLPDSIQESIDKVKKGTAAMVAEQKKQKSSKGVFSAFAAASLKGSSIEVQQLDVQKQMKKGIDSLNEKDNAFQLG